MNEVKVSPKYQVVIPLDVRTRLHIKPGQKLSIIVGEGSLALLPERSIKEMEGILRDISSEFVREPDRDL